MASTRSLLQIGVSATALLAAASTLVRAEDSAAPVTQLDAVTVSATRTPQTVGTVPGTVSVIDADQIAEQHVQKPDDLVRYEPGISVGNQPNRGGETNYTIRGIGDNRVLLLIDGIAVPDFPESNKGASTYTRDFIDFDTLKRVEIVRGPASALYGSDAIGGVVAYVTKDPADYLRQSGKDWYASFKSGFDSANLGFSETATGAWRAGNTELMAIYTRRDTQETEANGSIKANPQDDFTNNGLVKAVIHASDVDTWKLTGEILNRTVDTDVQSDNKTVNGFTFTGDPTPAPTTTTTDSRARDTVNRNRLSVEYIHDAPFGFIDTTDAKVYFTNLDLNERSRQLLTQVYPTPPAAPWPSDPSVRNSDFSFLQDIYGTDIQFGSKTNWFNTPNALVYGFNFSFTQSSHPRNRTQTDLLTGASTNVIDYETFPDKNFPDTDTIKTGAYFQDQVAFGPLTVVPGLRVDYYHLQPNVDAAFLNSNSSNPVHALTAVPVSPKLGATYKIDNDYTAFGQYAHGFRAPPYDAANFGFTNTQYFYTILPNADLKPETSDGFEGGLRGKFSDGSSFSVSQFYNIYSDFIDTKKVGTDASGNDQYKYVNLSNVTIYGTEARGDYRLRPDWSLLGSVAYAHGEDTDTKASIDSVDPLKVVFGIRYEHPTDHWNAQMVGTHAWSHQAVSDPTDFRAPAYTTFDLMAHYDLTPMVGLNAGVFNITDAKYFNSQDVIGVAANSTTVDRFAQPGRTVAVSMTVQW